MLCETHGIMVDIPVLVIHTVLCNKKLMSKLERRSLIFFDKCGECGLARLCPAQSATHPSDLIKSARQQRPDGAYLTFPPSPVLHLPAQTTDQRSAPSLVI